MEPTTSIEQDKLDASDLPVWSAPTEIIASGIPEMRQQLRSLVSAGIPLLVIDMSMTRMIDSTGIGLVVATHNSLAKTGGRIRLVHVRPEIAQLLRSMRLHNYFEILSAASAE